jgi:hypothetical protein
VPRVPGLSNAFDMKGYFVEGILSI